jgi:GTPase
MIKLKIYSKQLPNQPPEIYYGNKEYKISLDYSNNYSNISKILEKKASQMLFRLNEGDGKAIYLIGVEDNGIAKGIQINKLFISLYHLLIISKIIGSMISKINIYKGSTGFIATIRLFKQLNNNYLLYI